MMMKLGRGASITVDECLTSDCSRYENGLDGICNRLDGIFRKSVIDRQHDAAVAKPARHRQWRFRPQARGRKCLFAIDFRTGARKAGHAGDVDFRDDAFPVPPITQMVEAEEGMI